MRKENKNYRMRCPFSVLLVLLAIFQANAQEAEKEIREINIETLPGLQYDLVRFAVTPGEQVRLVFTNKDDMGHNLLITQPGSREEVVNAALQLAEKGPRMDYIPDTPDVLWAIPVIYQGESKALEFRVPDEPGAYPYVCTYPGHGFVMYGVMYVSPEGKMPDLTADLNVPPTRRQATLAKNNLSGDHQEHHQENKREPLHPYDPVPPYLYRVFIENSGLASIAVHLPQNISYCWDASACRLRFAWSGEFLDNEDLWHGHKNAYAKVLGEIFYEDKSEFPLRIGDSDAIPEAEYKGYRLIDRYPEFQYLLSGHAVYEIIYPKPDGTGLIRKFRIPSIEKTVWFVFEPGDGVTYEFPHGEWEEGKLKLSPEQAREFTITMTKEEGHIK